MCCSSGNMADAFYQVEALTELAVAGGSNVSQLGPRQSAPELAA